jgi:hypothetical protein
MVFVLLLFTRVVSAQGSVTLRLSETDISGSMPGETVEASIIINDIYMPEWIGGWQMTFGYEEAVLTWNGTVSDPFAGISYLNPVIQIGTLGFIGISPTGLMFNLDLPLFETLNPGDTIITYTFTYHGGETDLLWAEPTQFYDWNFEPFVMTTINGCVCNLTDYDVTFHVTADDEDLEGALITIGNLWLETDENGLAIFSLSDGQYDYIVTKPGYADEEGSFTVAGAPVDIEVEMVECYDVTFNVIPADSTIIIINGDTLVSGETICLPNGDYWVTVLNPGYFPFEGLITVASAPLSIEIILDPQLFEVTFFVNCCGEPQGGVPITIDNTTVISEVNGVVVFSLLPGSYTALVGVYLFNFTIPGTTYIDADVCSEATFHVTSEEGYPLEDVMISMGSNSLWTDANGEADTCLQAGNYSYSASKPGFVTQTGTFEMDTISQEVEIVMPLITYPVSFYCPASCDNQFNGWWLSINGESLNSGETIYLPEGIYSYSCGYLDCTMPILWNIYIQGPTNLNCFLMGYSEPHTIFHVSSSVGGNIQGAIVTVDTFALITNFSGEASFCLPEGDYYYSIIKEGYDTLTGIFTYSEQCNDTLINILMNPVLIHKQNSSEFKLYPNPSSGIFNVEIPYPPEEQTEMQVIDLTGRTDYSGQSKKTGRMEIDLSGQPKGMYFVRVKTGDKFLIRKIVIQ